ncbi:hypothetical protein FACS1894137_02540 [Spirochaetia bacterium]|nr:hypothetical protein FACS1894137_02540 [Spirochaetia bacterium]
MKNNSTVALFWGIPPIVGCTCQRKGKGIAIARAPPLFRGGQYEQKRP